MLASGSRGNCYRITDGKTPLLLECGIAIKKIKEWFLEKDYNLGEITGCLITHEHKDHCKAVEDVMKYGITCYMSEGTKKGISFKDDLLSLGEFKSLSSFRVASWLVKAFKAEHDTNEPVGYLLQNRDGERLLFLTDSYYCRYKFKGLTHIMIECNYAKDILDKNIEEGRIIKPMKDRIIQSHFELGNVKNFLKANDLSKVKEIWLLHLSDDNSDEERFKREIQEETGKVVYIANQEIYR